jgi:radical SAM superfamily enzyme YgiQ (UPF0313 family)
MTAPPANGSVTTHFALSSLGGRPERKTALLIAPPVYDTQYWAEWSQPYGLLRIAALLKKHRYKKLWLYDFMETGTDRKVSFHRISPDENYDENNWPSGKTRPIVIAKGNESLELQKKHFGKSWDDFEEYLKRRHLNRANPPTEVWISAVMSYWWESTRDLIARLHRCFGKRATIIVGGIYPSVAPAHAATMTGADIVVQGEIEEANDLWPDLTLYKNKPTYAIVTPSRGCPYDCHYCAQKTINSGVTRVRFRKPIDVLAEMRDKYERYGIRDFAFYADFLLFDWRNNLLPILREIALSKLPLRLYAPEGLDTRFLSQSQELLDWMKKSHFQKIYLPVESIDNEHVKALNRRHVKLEHFVQAARMCDQAGFELRNLDVNAFVLYGLPNEEIDRVVKTTLFVSEIVGSIIPMLFSPVPSTVLYERHLPFFRQRGWDRNLHILNGKLYPFLETCEGSISDYIDLQRLMFTLNAHYRSESFSIFGNSKVSLSLRENIRNGFESFVRSYKKSGLSQESGSVTAMANDSVSAREPISPLKILEN